MINFLQLFHGFIQQDLDFSDQKQVVNHDIYHVRSK